jgi:hypothetical protein
VPLNLITEKRGDFGCDPTSGTLRYDLVYYVSSATLARSSPDNAHRPNKKGRAKGAAF